MASFDIDDKIITLSNKHLRDAKDSVFGQLVRANKKELQNKQGAFYVDGHKNLVGHVLAWFERNKLPSGVMLLKLLEEAELYSLHSMKQQILKKLQYSSPILFDGVYLFSKGQKSWSFFLSFHQDNTVELVEEESVLKGSWSFGNGVIDMLFPIKSLNLTFELKQYEIENAQQHGILKVSQSDVLFGEFIFGTRLTEQLTTRRYKPFEIKKSVPNGNSSLIVEFNIGGKIVHLTEHALKMYPNSLFSMLYENKGKMKIDRDANGRIIINRDPTFINFIINYMEFKKLPITRFYVNMTKQEAEFYLLHEFIMDLKGRDLQFDGFYVVWKDTERTQVNFYLVFDSQDNDWSEHPWINDGKWYRSNEYIKLCNSNDEKYYFSFRDGKILLARDKKVHTGEFMPFCKLPEIRKLVQQ